MPKINVYLPDELAAAVRDAQIPVSAICQTALERAVRDVTSVRAAGGAPPGVGTGSAAFSRFTPRARQAIALAERAAESVPHDHVGTEHLLLGILDEGGNLALKVLTALEVEPDDLRAELMGSMAPPSPSAEPPEGHPPFTPDAKRALEATTKEALGLGHNYVGCEHVLLGLLAGKEGIAGNVLRRMGLELRTTRRAVVAALSGFVHAEVAPVATPAPPAAGDRPVLAMLADIQQRLDAIESRLAG